MKEIDQTAARRYEELLWNVVAQGLDSLTNRATKKHTNRYTYYQRGYSLLLNTTAQRKPEYGHSLQLTTEK